MKKLNGIIGDRRGVITMIMMIVLLAVGVLTLNTMLNSQMSQTSSNNYKTKIQTFYAADGLMTLLAQEMIDTCEDIYLKSALLDKEIGSTATSGYHSYNVIKNIDTIKSKGGDIWDKADTCHFVCSRVKGNVDISVNVNSVSPTNSWAKGGIMIREKLNAQSRMAMVFRPNSSANGVKLGYRPVESGLSYNKPSAAGTDASWIRLKRLGNKFTAFLSTSGSTWTLIDTVTISMSDSVYVGLAVSSHTTNSICTAIFSNLDGLVRRSFSDSTTVGASPEFPVKYTIDELGTGIFSMSTQAYKVKTISRAPTFVTNLNQSLSRERVENWYATVKDTALVPVTFYDMRGDGSNPEFNINVNVLKPCPPCVDAGSGVTMNPHMVRTDTLTSDRKPIKKTPNATFRSAFMGAWSPSWYTLSAAARTALYYVQPTTGMGNAVQNNQSLFNWDFNDSMHTWFRPWGDSVGKTGLYTYDYLNNVWSGLIPRPNWVYNSFDLRTEWVPKHWDPTRPFANIIIYDTLKFIEEPSNPGTFTFGKITTDPRWFLLGKEKNISTGLCVPWSKPKFMPLQYKGFGCDIWSTYFYDGCDSVGYTKQNFAFTMETHRMFTYKAGQNFKFQGDDDVFVFINNRLVIDLGGVHDVVKDSVFLDTCGLTEGKQYMFDFFYAERNVTGSNILITTNMLLFTPSQLTKRNWKRDYGNVD